MPTLKDAIRAQLAALKLHPTREADIAEEMTQHLEDRVRELMSRGISEPDAQHTVLEELRDGNLARALAGVERPSPENPVTLGDTGARSWPERVLQDIRFGARTLARKPAFSIVAILTLALGIGANTAIFSVLRSVLLRPLPYAAPEQLVQVWSDHRALGRAEPEWLTPPDFADWRDNNRTFQSMAAYQGWGPDLTGTGEPESLQGLIVSGNFFDMLGARASLGRVLSMTDDDAVAERVIMLSHAFWARRFGSDSSIIGRPLTLSGFDWKVVGVLPPDFRAPTPSSPDVVRATRRPPNAQCGRGCIVLRVVGRLKPDVSLASAQADLQRLALQEAKDFPRTNDKVGAWLIPLHEQLTGKTKPALFALSSAVAFVLLIGCVNLANLLLVRGASRHRELGVRAALGAGQGRIVQQLLTENALLAAVGGSLGLGLGVAGSRLLATLVPVSVRQVQDVRVDFQVLLFAVAITVLATALFGVFPAFQAVRANLMGALRSGVRETGHRANITRNSLVVAQLSLAVVLLVGAGLLLRSFLVMQRTDLGFRSDGVQMAAVGFPPARYQDPKMSVAAVNTLVEHLRADPSVRSVEFTDLPPLNSGDQDITAIPVGEPERTDLPPSIWYRSVSPGYFSQMHLKIVAGRALTAEDRDGATLAGVINEEAARRFWPGKDPVGRIMATGRDPEAPKFTVVGVVASSRQDGPSQPYKCEVFLPYSQFPSRFVTLMIEPRSDAAAVGRALKAALHDVDPLVPMPELIPISKRVGEAVSVPRLYATLVGVFAAAALLLAVLGVYGVMAYAVSQRQREIGVRLALGAEPSSIRRMVLSQGGRLAIAGSAIGIAAALGLGQLMGALLFGVKAYDFPTLFTVTVVLSTMSLLASWLPARRAMRVDPLLAMRAD